MLVMAVGVENLPAFCRAGERFFVVAGAIALGAIMIAREAFIRQRDRFRRLRTHRLLRNYNYRRMIWLTLIAFPFRRFDRYRSLPSETGARNAFVWAPIAGLYQLLGFRRRCSPAALGTICLRVRYKIKRLREQQRVKARATYPSNQIPAQRTDVRQFVVHADVVGRGPDWRRFP